METLLMVMDAQAPVRDNFVEMVLSTITQQEVSMNSAIQETPEITQLP